MKKVLFMKNNYPHLPYREKVWGLVLNENNQVLLIQAVDYKINEWSFPGGGVDEGESEEEAVLRELSEELGVSEDCFRIVKKSVFKHSYFFPDELVEKHGKQWKGQRAATFLLKMVCDKNFKLQVEELKDFKWVDVKDLEKYLVFPNQWIFVQELLKEFNL